jgi:uncharacterized Zn finger protein
MDGIPLTDSQVRALATPAVFRRGRDYADRGMVLSLFRRGDLLYGIVQGSEPYPYDFWVTLSGNNVTTMSCSCPFEESFGGACKHIVAALLVAVEQPGAIHERRTIESVLEGLDRDQLAHILINLSQSSPTFADFIETAAGAVRGIGPSSGAGIAPIDPEVFRTRARAVFSRMTGMRPSEAYWHIAGVLHDYDLIMHEAWAIAIDGATSDALRPLQAVTEEYLKAWAGIDDSNGDVSDLIYSFGTLWSEALLNADLTPEERAEWGQTMNAWVTELEAYGLDDALFSPIEALDQWWDDPRLVEILHGEFARPVDPDAPMPEGARSGTPSVVENLDVVTARLNILGRQGRHEEYKYLAEAAGLIGHVTSAMLRLGEADAAIDLMLETGIPSHLVLELAIGLYDQGQVDAAFHLADVMLNAPSAGLSITSTQHHVAAWLRDAAAERGDLERARRAALVAIRTDPRLDVYLRAREIAGDGWAQVRDEMLASLDPDMSLDPTSIIDIYLHEGMIDEAIDAAENAWYVSPDIFERIADAAVDLRPEWVIDLSMEAADDIIDRAKSARYEEAAEWLARAKAAFKASGRDREWRALLDERIERHKRKYKLRPLLAALDE